MGMGYGAAPFHSTLLHATRQRFTKEVRTVVGDVRTVGPHVFQADHGLVRSKAITPAKAHDQKGHSLQTFAVAFASEALVCHHGFQTLYTPTSQHKFALKPQPERLLTPKASSGCQPRT